MCSKAGVSIGNFNYFRPKLLLDSMAQNYRNIVNDDLVMLINAVLTERRVITPKSINRADPSIASCENRYEFAVTGPLCKCRHYVPLYLVVLC